jgi:hypothetical protein
VYAPLPRPARQRTGSSRSWPRSSTRSRGVRAAARLLDAGSIDHRRVDDGRATAAWLFDGARARGLAIVPVTGLRRSAAYQLAVAEAASVDDRGVCLRLELPDLADLDDLPERVHTLVDLLGVPPEQVDLLVDLGHVAAAESRVLIVAARGVLSPLRRAAGWRSVALAATACTLNGTPAAAGPARSGAPTDHPAAHRVAPLAHARRRRSRARLRRLRGPRRKWRGRHTAHARGVHEPAARDRSARRRPPRGRRRVHRAAPRRRVAARATTTPDAPSIDGYAAAVARHLTIVVEGIARTERADR